MPKITNALIVGDSLVVSESLWSLHKKAWSDEAADNGVAPELDPPRDCRRRDRSG